MKFTVVITALKVDKYLFECIDSIKNQTLKEKEIIICLPSILTKENIEVLTWYIKDFSDAKLIIGHDKNINTLLNKSIKESLGDYIIFINGNEKLDIKALKNFYSEMNDNNLNMLTFDYYLVDSDRKKDLYSVIIDPKIKLKDRSRFIRQDIMNNLDFIEMLFIKKIDFDDLSLYVFDTKFLKKHRLYFDENLYYDSSLFILACLLRLDIKIRYRDYDYLYKLNVQKINNNVNYINLNNIEYNYYIINCLYNLSLNQKTNIYNLLIEYILEYVYQAYHSVTISKNEIDLNYITKLFLLLKNKAYENCSVENKIKIDMLIYSPEMYPTISENSIFRFRNAIYRNIVTLCKSKMLVSGDDFDKKDIDKIVETINSDERFKKYVSYDFISDILNHSTNIFSVDRANVINLIDDIINDLYFETNKFFKDYSETDKKISKIVDNIK